MFIAYHKANKAYLIPDKLREFMDKDPNAIKSIAPTLRKIERVNDLDFSESFRKYGMDIKLGEIDEDGKLADPEELLTAEGEGSITSSEDHKADSSIKEYEDDIATETEDATVPSIQEYEERTETEDAAVPSTQEYEERIETEDATVPSIQEYEERTETEDA